MGSYQQTVSHICAGQKTSAGCQQRHQALVGFQRVHARMLHMPNQLKGIGQLTAGNLSGHFIQCGFDLILPVTLGIKDNNLVARL